MNFFVHLYWDLVQKKFFLYSLNMSGAFELDAKIVNFVYYGKTRKCCVAGPPHDVGGIFIKLAQSLHFHMISLADPTLPTPRVQILSFSISFRQKNAK